jgi:hypothetical protein
MWVAIVAGIVLGGYYIGNLIYQIVNYAPMRTSLGIPDFVYLLIYAVAVFLTAGGIAVYLTVKDNRAYTRSRSATVVGSANVVGSVTVGAGDTQRALHPAKMWRAVVRFVVFAVLCASVFENLYLGGCFFTAFHGQNMYMWWSFTLFLVSVLVALGAFFGASYMIACINLRWRAVIMGWLTARNRAIVRVFAFVCALYSVVINAIYCGYFVWREYFYVPPYWAEKQNQLPMAVTFGVGALVSVAAAVYILTKRGQKHEK